MTPSFSGYISVNDFSVVVRGGTETITLHQTLESTQEDPYRTQGPFMWLMITLPTEPIALTVDPDPETCTVKRIKIARKLALIHAPPG